ncbi:DNA primase [Rhizosaccharibacter radicis]|uniref:DNA primase n=1 Tax=Rhizosaccharibacter radicis TaxID=2782605 RepID=A0ABT1VZE5_9PROT|nr:DNA primase [Acetobacteraceae bacterium KSS12]
MAFDPAFLDELRARTPIAAVVGRRTKLVRSGRQFKACCPFHGEKTPSFYVYDDHFHCFGCGAHGDAISFVMQSEGRSFLEAVEGLAAEAGLEVPKQRPADREKAERSRGLSDVLDAAQSFFARNLREPGGRAGLDYLRRRGLDDRAIEAWGLGWSGEGRGGLIEMLKGRGFPPEMVAEAGLMRLDENGKPKGELFFNRVTFPIRDKRGALVSFGGRILGDGQPKYLNGPETPLFSKRRTLFGLHQASNALRGPRPAGVPDADRALVVVEGYMDVIALHEAGFRGAVAPLGTALTAEQLDALWRIAPVPVLCFDGDAAGRRAAIRAAETALPALDPERSVAFCRLPEGEDPDSLIRQNGREAMRALLERPAALGDVLFELLSEGIRDPGPEQRAALHARLTAAAATIEHKGLAAEYRRTLTGRFFEAFARRGGGRPGRGHDRNAPPRVVPGERPVPSGDLVRRERQRQLLAILLRHPDLLHDVEQAFCGLGLPEDFGRLRHAMLDWAGSPCESQDPFDGGADDHPRRLDSEGLMAHLHSAGLSAELEAVLGGGGLPVSSDAGGSAMPADAERAWWHFFGFLNLSRLEHEVEAAKKDFIADPTDPRQLRLTMLIQTQRAHQRGEMADEDEMERLEP